MQVPKLEMKHFPKKLITSKNNYFVFTSPSLLIKKSTLRRHIWFYEKINTKYSSIHRVKLYYPLLVYPIGYHKLSSIFYHTLNTNFYNSLDTYWISSLFDGGFEEHIFNKKSPQIYQFDERQSNHSTKTDQNNFDGLYLHLYSYLHLILHLAISGKYWID